MPWHVKELEPQAADDELLPVAEAKWSEKEGRPSQHGVSFTALLKQGQEAIKLEVPAQLAESALAQQALQEAKCAAYACSVSGSAVLAR